VRVNLFIKIGAILAIAGIVGFALDVASLSAIEGQAFVKQSNTDANDIQKFADYDSGDEVIIVDTISRMEYDTGEGSTFFWLDSFENKELYFACPSNHMEDFGIGDKINLKLEIVDQGQSEGFICEVNSGFSIFDYAFIGLTLVGIGLSVFGFVGVTAKKIRPNVVEDEWGASSSPAMAPAPVAPPPTAAPGIPPQPQAPPSMAAIPGAPPVAPPPTAPSTMTITVPPGVVSGQVLTVTMPNGQVVNVQVPPGCAPGSQFTISVTQ